MDENSLQFYLFMISITIIVGSFIVGCFLLFVAKRQHAFSEKCLATSSLESVVSA